MVFIKEKKGLIFTIVALVISAFLLLMFFYILEVPLDKDVEVSTIKVKSANTFLEQVEDLAKAQAVISSKSAINTFLRHMHDENQFLDDFNASFYRCLNTGLFSFDDGPFGSLGNSFSCGEESFFKNKLEQDLANFARDNLGANTILRVSNFILSQASPWDLEISFDLDVELMKEGFYWNVSSSLSMPFSILGLKDPAHAVVDNSVRTHRPDDFAELVAISYHSMFNMFSDEWSEKPSTLNILSMANNYIHNETFGVSYLDRLRGDMTPSEFGIFRIQLPIYDGGSIVYSGNSNIDWVFWQDEDASLGDLGIYDFIESEDKALVLGLTPPYILENTLHGAIVPVTLAQAANVSGVSYFVDLEEDDPDDPDDPDDDPDDPSEDDPVEPFFTGDLIVSDEPTITIVIGGDIDAVLSAALQITNGNYNQYDKADLDGDYFHIIWEESEFTKEAYEDLQSDGEKKWNLHLTYRISGEEKSITLSIYDSDDPDDDGSVIIPTPGDEPFIESHDLSRLPEEFVMVFGNVKEIVYAEIYFTGDSKVFEIDKIDENTLIWEDVFSTALFVELSNEGFAHVDVEIQYRNADDDIVNAVFEKYEMSK